MITYLKKYVREQFEKRGRLIIPCVPKEKIVTLIKKLRPCNVGIELIRLGPNCDGGYLVPNDLDGIEACFSPGVDEVSEFEADCFKKGMKLFLADKSVTKPNLNLSNNDFSFLKKYVGCTNNEDFITMDQWVNSSGLDDRSELLLQMDIEGAEFFTILSMTDSLLLRFRIIVIEFHGLHNLWNGEFYNMAETTFSKLLQTHTCVHIHPNNSEGISDKFDVKIPYTAEFTFIRNDRVKQKTFHTVFPHKLDYDCTPDPHMPLPENWYK